jgi:hypothetical protein
MAKNTYLLAFFSKVAEIQWFYKCGGINQMTLHCKSKLVLPSLLHQKKSAGLALFFAYRQAGNSFALNIAILCRF